MIQLQIDLLQLPSSPQYHHAELLRSKWDSQRACLHRYRFTGDGVHRSCGSGEVQPLQVHLQDDFPVFVFHTTDDRHRVAPDRPDFHVVLSWPRIDVYSLRVKTPPHPDPLPRWGEGRVRGKGGFSSVTSIVTGCRYHWA